MVNWRIIILFLLIIFCAPISATTLDVKVQGVDGELYTNVLAHLSIAAQKSKTDGLTESRIRYLFSNAEKQIRDALKPYGYYSPAIQVDLQQGSDGNFSARFDIEKGRPVLIDSVQLEVTGGMASDKLDAPFKNGQILDQAVYDKYKSTLLAKAWEAGYLDAKLVNTKILLNPERYVADIVMLFDSGPRYRLGDFVFTGDALDDDLLQRYAEWAQHGDLTHTEEFYTGSVVRRLHRALLDSEFFRSVEIKPGRDKVQDGRIPVQIQLLAEDKDKYRLGGGYATDTGIRGVFDWRRRLVNQRGHSAYIETSFSTVKVEILGQYRIPLEDPVSDYFSINPEYVYYDTSSRKGSYKRLGVSYSTVSDAWRRTLSLNYELEDYDIAETSDRTKELVVSVVWLLNKNDSILKTKKGYRLRFALHGAIEGLVTDASFLQANVSAKKIISASDKWRFILRAELAATLAESVDVLSGSRRLVTGGDSSIRGYKYEELGPTDDVGDVIGGRYLAVASLEAERKIYDKWSGAIFVDAGNAFDPDLANSAAVGVGFGVRWLSPIGQVRLDLAWGLDKQQDQFRFHVIIGPDL